MKHLLFVSPIAVMLAACAHSTVPATFHNTGKVNYTVSWGIKGAYGAGHTVCSDIAVNDSCQFTLPIGQTVEVFAEKSDPMKTDITTAANLLGTITLNVQDHPYKLHIKNSHEDLVLPETIGGVLIPGHQSTDYADLEIETP